VWRAGGRADREASLQRRQAARVARLVRLQRHRLAHLARRQAEHTKIMSRMPHACWRRRSEPHVQARATRVTTEAQAQTQAELRAGQRPRWRGRAAWLSSPEPMQRGVGGDDWRRRQTNTV
jgi:hypothetical protein